MVMCYDLPKGFPLDSTIIRRWQDSLASYRFTVYIKLRKKMKIILRNYYCFYYHLRDFSLFGVCPSNKHCPSVRCAYVANAVDKDLDIFAIGAFSLNNIYTHQPEIVNIICSQF
jgi:hypothetical protein